MDMGLHCMHYINQQSDLSKTSDQLIYNIL